MAKKKLTLSVDEGVIRRAKRFSAEQGTTVSRLVTEFLASLEHDPGEATPVVSRLRGVLPADASREDYRDHLRDKHRG